MQKKFNYWLITVSGMLILMLAFTVNSFSQKPVKVFILAGQSNMQGHGEILKGAKGNLTWLVNNDKAGRYKHLVDNKGEWKIRDDVFIYYKKQENEVCSGGLTVGYGASANTIGPELQFGNVIGDYFDEKVLLIKTCWGGKSLAVDFLSPSAAGKSGYRHIPYAPKDTGYYYVQMLAIVNGVLDSISNYVPGYQGEGYEIAGFGWHQGWNDRINQKNTDTYESNMVHFIRDVRKDLGVPGLPFVIATTGMGGWEEKNLRALALMKAQLAVATYPDFKGNVAVVDTRDFWRKVEDSPADQIYHWNRNAESYFLIGDAMARMMIDLLKSGRPETEKFPVAGRRVSEYRGLAPTPPMGWNSWNAFGKDINEKIIQEIADEMVNSGMKAAGYKYLVLDDGWMAPKRDSKGELKGDSIKFPGDMKAVGDYIHSKGLKFGIYACRGYKTCQQLPGSYQHEQTDMSTFASWGVDYIKLDACFAEKNGRLSPVDLAIYREAINNTGRKMILSISDFGNGAWAWGGKKFAQLWRTSGDIYPSIGSVYNCANTSGGDGRIHPAFNGLWQFAGPGHWNDPDMLEVGNLRKRTEDKAHFSLWCILSAPLMAGNDLRKMSDTVRNILTAPEVIEINQDPRGHQGYKVFEKDGAEIYNKPLSDGTTAVLLLNKGKKKTDLTVKWKQIGLKGAQKVRDLWEQKDLGTFRGSFTARNLGQDELLLIRVGTRGRPPIPGPKPVPSEKYTIAKGKTTFLSDIYYVMKGGNAPVMNKNFNGKPLQINGTQFDKGLGCKSKSTVMYELDGLGDRFHAIAVMDDASKENETGRFRVLAGDAFGGTPIFDSGKKEKGTKEIKIDIDVKGLDFILLEFTGKEVFGNWVDAKVVAID